MLKRYRKHDFPVHQVRRYLEPGPVLLLSSAWRGERDVMAFGWHTVMEFSPSLVGCMISAGNHSFELVRGSGECVLNLPAADMGRVIAGVGNCSGADTDKFARFGLHVSPAARVAAPLIDECHSSFECRLHDARLVEDYNFFVFEVVAAHVARVPKWPKTLGYRGEGLFMESGRQRRLSSAK